MWNSWIQYSKVRLAYLGIDIDMEKHDKYIMIGSIITALFLLYMIKPAPANAFCSDWNDNLYDRFTTLDKQFTKPSQKLANEWMTLQRESIIYTTACTDISIFFI